MPKPKKGQPVKRPSARRSPPAAAAKQPRRGKGRAQVDVVAADPSLFAPLTEGERADALRCLLEDDRLRPMAKVGRYRVITVEPLVVKPPEPLAGRRLARVVIYDYAGDKCVDACVDLDRGAVCFVSQSTAQPMLSTEEEREAMAVAVADSRVQKALGPGERAQGVMHYWSQRVIDLAYRRRAAAVTFGTLGARPRLVAVVDLIDRVVVEVVPAEQW